jgi:lipopolysaccharide export system protein LptC
LVRPVGWLPLVILALLAGLTFWLNQLVQAPAIRADGALRHDPDLVVENFRAKKLGEDGKVLYTLVARKMVHYPDDNSAQLEKIVLEAFAPDQPKATITAERGQLLEGGDRVWFEGNVVVAREADERIEASRLTTDKLLVLPDDGLARTASPVVLENASGRVVADGLELNNQTRIARLDKVRATYKPRRR